jgi:ferric-dicitrate binding protein FerR (iron transport regulator)
MDYQVVLADGSEVWLNSTSSLEFPFAFTGNTRDITIRGEAYLKIAKNQQHPFIVHLPDSKVQVTGTEFNVNSFDSAVVKISLVEGAVLFVGGKDSIALTPGRQGVYAKGENLYDQSFNQRNTLSWMQGIHYFEKSGMDEIIGVISRWYNVKVVVDNSRNSDKRFVGVLNKKKPLADFLKTLEYVADIYSHYDSRGVLHFK